MGTLILTEIRKLFSTRAGAALVAAPVLYPIAVVALVSAGDATADLSALDVVRGVGDVAVVIWLVVGAWAIAGEFADGSIVSTVIATPDRRTAYTAKVTALFAVAVAATAVAALLGLLAAGISDPEGWWGGRDLSDVLVGSMILAAVAGAFAVVGAAVGFVVRRPTAVALGCFAWPLVVERAVPTVVGADGIARWMPSRAAVAAIDSVQAPDELTTPAALAVVVAVTAAAVVAGSTSFVRRDVVVP